MAATQADGLQTVFDRESLVLAPYASFSRDSRGRRYPEPDHRYRGPYQRDRDRVVHSSAFRRLSGKMQVFTGEMGDYHRTRLTHTHEVASIARTIARALQLNEDLAETLALLHDIGHPPFGHAGEEALHQCLQEVGGFSHNAFALTLVESLERRYPDFPGLNLTSEVLEGQQARTEKDSPHTPRLEVQVVDLADSISYDAADIDDAVKLGLVEIDDLKQIPIIEQMVEIVAKRNPGLRGGMLRRAVVHELIDFRVSRLLESAGKELTKAEIESADAAKQTGFRLRFPPELQADFEALESFLYQRVYRHPRLVAVREQAQQRVRELFAFFQEHAESMPPRPRRRIDDVGPARAVGEYIAGMTDRFCDRSYEELIGD